MEYTPFHSAAVFRPSSRPSITVPHPRLVHDNEEAESIQSNLNNRSTRCRFPGRTPPTVNLVLSPSTGGRWLIPPYMQLTLNNTEPSPQK